MLSFCSWKFREVQYIYISCIDYQNILDENDYNIEKFKDFSFYKTRFTKFESMYLKWRSKKNHTRLLTGKSPSADWPDVFYIHAKKIFKFLFRFIVLANLQDIGSTGSRRQWSLKPPFVLNKLTQFIFSFE